MRSRTVTAALAFALVVSITVVVPTVAQAATPAIASAGVTEALEAQLASQAAAGNPAAQFVLRGRETFQRNPQLPSASPKGDARERLAAIQKKQAGGGFQTLAFGCTSVWYYLQHGETARNVKFNNVLYAFANGQASSEPWNQYVLPCYDPVLELWAFYSNRGAGFLYAPPLGQLFVGSSPPSSLEQTFLVDTYDGNWLWIFSLAGSGWYVSGHTTDPSHPVYADTYPLNGTALWKVIPA